MLRDSRDIVRRLKQDGFELAVRGSHHKFVHPRSRRMVILTHPRRDIPKGTVKANYAQAGWKQD